MCAIAAEGKKAGTTRRLTSLVFGASLVRCTRCEISVSCCGYLRALPCILRTGVCAPVRLVLRAPGERVGVDH